MTTKRTQCRGYVVLSDGQVVQCDLVFAEYDGPARVSKTANQYYAAPDLIIDQFDWCVTRDAYIARASLKVKERIKNLEEVVQGHRDDIKRMGSALYLEDAVKLALSSIETWKDYLRKVHNEGPTLHLFPETL